MKDCFVFDLDGTLVESLPGIAEGLNRALAAVGCAPHSQDTVRRMIGRGAENLCAAALGFADAAEAPAAELAALYAAFRREYPLCWQGAGTVPFAGIPHMLSCLVAAGGCVAVLSNKPQEVTERMVPALFPGVPFAPVLGHSSDFPRKPSPAALEYIAGNWGVPVSQLTLVGDSLIDACTARNARCACVLVSWGYADPQALREAGFPVVDTVEQLAACLLTP